MFLKNVNLTIYKKISLRARLGLFYGLTAFILLTIISVFLYWETINILYKADYQFLTEEVETIQYILNNKAANLSALKEEVVQVPSTPNSSIYRFYTRVYDSHRQLIMETPGIDSIIPAEKSIRHSLKEIMTQNFRWYTHDDTNYLLIQAPIKLGNKKSGYIEIALDISYQHSVISDRKFFIIAVLASTVCALFLGFFIAYRGMRSLYSLTDTVKKITASSLHQRIDPKSMPKELRELGEAFNEMLDRIEASFTRLKQFSSDLAHELRTPINNLLGQSEITLSHSSSVQEFQQIMGSNLEELHRISQLIENILFLARAENPQLDLQKSSFDVNHKVSGVCEYYQAMAEEKNITVTYEGSAHLIANPIMFRRMISNILSNSLNYTPPGGRIHFSINALHHGNVQIIASDNGIGIPANHLSRIFDRFYRVDSSRTQIPGGTGLGLAIVKSIMDLHQGTISITSEPDKGTSICLTFPK